MNDAYPLMSGGGGGSTLFHVSNTYTDSMTLQKTAKESETASNNKERNHLAFLSFSIAVAY